MISPMIREQKIEGQDRRLKKKLDSPKYETVYKGVVSVKAEN